MPLHDWTDARAVTGKPLLAIAQAILDGRIPAPRQRLVWTHAEFKQLVEELREDTNNEQ